jgi:general secretion pathway protein C
MLPARRHRLLVELGLLAIVAFLAGLGVRQAVLVSLDAPLPAIAVAAEQATDDVGPLADYAVITERNLFAASPAAAATEPRAAALRLWGIAFAGDQALAVIEDTETRTQALYRVGDRVRDGRLASIGWDRATVAFDGGDAVLEMAREPAPADVPAAEGAPPEPPAGDRIRRTGENAYLVDRREITGALGNTSGLLTQLRAVAEVREGRPAGFRLFRIRDESLFARLGLRDGDVVERVNGTEVHDPAALLRFLERLGHEPRVALDIVRADAPRTLVYDLR